MSKTSLLLLAVLFCFNANANEASIKETLQKNYPQVGKIDQVNKTPIAGLYEVVNDGNLFYTDDKAQYIFTGNIIELKNRKNLTEERSQKLFAISFNSLPFELAVKRVKGNGERKMAYFTDTNCSYCKKLEYELKNVDNVTLYRFLYPILTGSEERVNHILCADDPNKKFEDWMLNGVAPPPAKCSNQTEAVVALGKKLHVNGTPSLIFANDRKVPGYMPAAELEKALNAAAGR